MGIIDTIANLNPVASVVGSVVNGISNVVAQGKANKANKEIAAENNKAALEAMRENNQFQRDASIEMFNLENEYNDPSQVRKRLEAAGMNPFIGMSGSGSQMVTSADAAAPTGTSVPSFATPHIEPVRFPFDQVIPQMAQSMRDISESNLKESEKTRNLTLLNHEVNRLISETENNMAQKNWTDTQNILQQNKYPYDIQEKVANAYSLCMRGKLDAAETLVKKIEREMQDEQLKFFKKQSPLLLNQLRAQIDLVREQQNTEKAKQDESRASAEEHRQNAEKSRLEGIRIKDLTPHQRKQAIYEAAKAVEEMYGIQLDNQQKESLMPLLEKELENQVRQQGSDYWNPFRYMGMVLGGAAGASIKAIIK